MPTPKPAKADADAHREEDDEEEHEGQDMAAIPDDAEPRDRDGGGGAGGDDGATPGAGGTLTSVFTSKRFLLLIGAIASAYVAYRYYQSSNGGSLSLDTDALSNGDEAGEEEEEEDGRPQKPDIKKDPEDPLAADDQAFQWVFGDQPQSESQYPGRR